MGAALHVRSTATRLRALRGEPRRYQCVPAASARARSHLSAVPRDARALERGDCLIKELGVVLRLDYGTLSPLLKRLEAAGLIRRARRAEDERSVKVMLTNKGATLREEAETVPTFIGNAIGLDSESLTTLRTSLGQLTALVTASS